MSPFENLLGGITKITDLVTTILIMLQLTGICVSTKMNEQQQQLNEREFVHQCLNKLVTGNKNVAHRLIWLDFIKVFCKINEAFSNSEEVFNIARQRINTLDEFFMVAHSVIIGLASKGKSAYKICSILPLSQKQIQENYSQLGKKVSLTEIYPPVFNATIFNSLLTFPGGTNKQFFYSALEETVLTNLILNRRVLMHATRNIYLMLNSITSQPAEISLLYERLSRTPPSQPSKLKSPTQFFKSEKINGGSTIQITYLRPRSTNKDLIPPSSSSSTTISHFNLTSPTPPDIKATEENTEGLDQTKAPLENSDECLPNKTPYP